MKLEYNDQNTIIFDVTQIWKTALLQWTNERGQLYDAKVKHHFEPPSPTDACLLDSRKQKAEDLTNNVKGLPQKNCCVDG